MDKREKLLDLIGEFRNAMLVTRDGNGDLQARPMNVAEHDEQAGTVTFVSSIASDKIEEMRANPSVCVSFQGGGRFVSLTGSASINQDRPRIHALWSEAWKLWFPEGPEQRDICLIDFEPIVGEYWDNAGLQGLSFAWNAAKGLIKGEAMQADGDEHHGEAVI